MKKLADKGIAVFSLSPKLKIGVPPVNVGVNMIYHVQRVSFLIENLGGKGERPEIESIRRSKA
jgi:hypothetical protein